MESKKKRFQGIRELFRSIERDHVPAFSAQCAFFFILSFIPLMILLLTLIQYTGVEAEELFDVISRIIPDSMNDFVLGLVREIYSKSIGTISISLIVTVYAAARGFYGLIRGLHFIYNYSDNKKRSPILLRIWSLILTVIFIVIVILSLSLLVLGKPIINTLRSNFSIFANYTALHEVIMRFVFLVLLFLVILLVYRILPGHKIKLKSQFLGAAFSSIGINILSFIISNYLNGYIITVTYGSLATVFAIMLWTYFLFYIIFIGAEINKYFEIRSNRIKGKQRRRLAKEKNDVDTLDIDLEKDKEEESKKSKKINKKEEDLENQNNYEKEEHA